MSGRSFFAGGVLIVALSAPPDAQFSSTLRFYPSPEDRSVWVTGGSGQLEMFRNRYYNALGWGLWTGNSEDQEEYWDWHIEHCRSMEVAVGTLAQQDAFIEAGGPDYFRSD